MDYSVNLSIGDALRQVHDLNLWAWFVAAYFGAGIAQWAGKRLAVREINKAIDPIANAFYAGAVYGLVYSQHHPKMIEPRFIVAICNRLELAHYLKNQTYKE